jgi:hypothetical protein
MEENNGQQDCASCIEVIIAVVSVAHPSRNI